MKMIKLYKEYLKDNDIEKWIKIAEFTHKTWFVSSELKILKPIDLPLKMVNFSTFK